MNARRSLLAGLPALFLAAGQAQAGETITFAIAGPITGPQAAIGEDMMAGARTAAERINMAGGILGKRLTLLSADDECTGKSAVSAANKVVGEQIGFVVGHYCSAATMPASKVYNENGVVQITMSQAVGITQQNFDMLFRITPNAAELSKGYIDTVKAEYNKGNNRIAIVGTNDQYARDISAGLEKNLREQGLPIHAMEHYAADDKDFSTLVTKLKMRSINLVLLSGGEQQMGMIVRQAGDHGFNPQFIVSSTALSSDFAMIAGGCGALGVKSVAAWNPLYLPGETNEALLKSLQNHGANGIDTAINVYSAVMAMAQAIGQAGSENTVEVAQALHKGSFDLPIGEIQFTVSGELAHPRAITYEFQSDKTPCQSVHPRPFTP